MRYRKAPRRNWERAHVDTPALILGNGPSRQNINHRNFRGLVFGCNAVARDLVVDYVCGVDPKMRKIWHEEKHQTPEAYFFWGRKQSGMVGKVPRYEVFIFDERPLKVIFSGTFAICLAMYMGCNPIFLAGFDGGKKNIYAGTRGYHIESKRNDIISAETDDALELLINIINRMYKIPKPKLYQLPPFTLKYAEPLQEATEEYWINAEAAKSQEDTQP